MIHTTEQISQNQALTPEGFLLCSGVAIARTGTLIYADGEIPADPNEEGVIYVKRTPEEVFSDEAMASFEGKPVTNLHPNELVNPENWQEVAVGTVQNVRQEGNLLVADLLITQAEAIKDVQDGLREVSCGYEAQYEQTQPGYASQKGIVGNHVALVPAGRCGPSCSIKDNAMTKKLTIKDRLMAAFKTRDEASIKGVLDELEDEPGGDLHIHMAEAKDEEADPNEERFKRIEDAIASLTPKTEDADPEEKDKVEDADEDEDEGEKPTGDSFQTVLSKAAILSPGIKFSVPTGDAKSAEFKDALCGCKLQALKAAYGTDAGKNAIEPFLAGRSLDKIKGASLDAVFAGASTLMAQLNNTGRKVVVTKDFGHAPSTPSDINKANREFWANRSRSI